MDQMYSVILLSNSYFRSDYCNSYFGMYTLLKSGLICQPLISIQFVLLQDA